MARSFNIGRLPSGTPNIISYKYTSGQTFKKGALVVDVAAGTISECGADPAAVLGVACEDAGSRPGNNVSGTADYVTGGNKDEVSVLIADRSQVFTCRGINGGTDPLTPTLTMVGEQYGVAKVSTDWVMDQAEVTAKVVEVVDIDIDNKLFLVKFIESVLALP